LNAIMTAVAVCLYEYKEPLQNQLNIFMQDELEEWQLASKKTEEADVVTTNVDSIIHRVDSLSPQQLIVKADKTLPVTITKQVTELIQAATNPQNLCCMDPTWLALF